jgi:hypothetical protein
MSQLVEGETLYLRAGTYSTVWNASLGIPSGTEGNPITIRGYGSEVPAVGRFDLNTYSTGTYHDLIFKQLLLDGSGQSTDLNAIYISGPNITRVLFEDLEVRNWGRNGIQSFGTSHLTFRRLHVHHNGVAAAQQRHGFYVAIRDGVIENCLVHDNYSYGIQVYDGTNPDGANGMIVRNNRVYKSTEFGGITASWGNGIQIYNNVVVNHPVHGIHLLAGGSPTGTVIAHNTLYNAGPTGISIVSGPTATQVKNNIILTSTTPIANLGTGTIFAANLCDTPGTGCALTGTASTLVTSPADSDFMLLATSPARDAGVDVSITTDLLGAARPYGALPDIGAYEYSQPVGGIVRYVAAGASERTCGEMQNIATPTNSIAAAAACMVPGDITYVRAGTYPAIASTAMTLPSGTSQENAPRIEAYQNEVVTVPQISLSTSNGQPVRYLILRKLVVDRQGQSGAGVLITGGAHNIRLDDLEVRNAGGHDN